MRQLSTPLTKPIFHVSLSHRHHSNIVSLETRNFLMRKTVAKLGSAASKTSLQSFAFILCSSRGTKLVKCPLTDLPGKNSLEVIKGREWKISCFGLVRTSNLKISHFRLAEMYLNTCCKCGHFYFSSFRRSNFLHVTDHPRKKLPPGRFYGVVKKNKRFARDSSR